MLTDLLFPLQCVGCGTELAHEVLCTRCAASLLSRHTQCPRCSARLLDHRICNPCRPSLGFSHLATTLAYSHPMARASIDAMKFEGIRALAIPLTDILAKNLDLTLLPKGSAVLAMPLYPKREAERGFNQAHLIAELLAKKIGLRYIPPEHKVLVRARETLQQAKLSREKRLANMRDAFSVQHPNVLAGKTILLVDDVITTGSTMGEAARTLTRAGAKTVWAVAIAQG